MLDKDKSIMVISTTCLQVPPDEYGGVEQMAYNLCHELGSRGYDVTCVAPEGTEIENVSVIETVEPTDSQDCFNREPDAYEEYAPKMPEHDIIIDHSWQKCSYVGKSKNKSLMEDIPILGVWHGMPSVRMKPPVDNPCYMSVSNAAAKAWSDYTGLKVKFAHNGIDMSRYPLREDSWTDGEYLLTLNRIMKEKGIHEFIKLCDKHEQKFIVAGEDSFVDDMGYVHEAMRLCAESDYGKYLGTVSQEKKVELLRNAKKTFLLPMHGYQEVFGLAAVESMACGTPAVCLDNNGLSEVVDMAPRDYVCEDLDEVETLIKTSNATGSGKPKPTELRNTVFTHFSDNSMTDQYLMRCEEALESPW